MIMPSDKDYKETKLIMQGKETMKQEFKPLADWIDKTYDVKTINIIYDTIDKGQRPRLQICFEFEREKSKFLDKEKSIFHAGKQKEIANRFKLTLQEQGLLEKKDLWSFLNSGMSSKYMTENIWVIYGAFEPIARIEANESIPRDKVVELQKSLNNPDLWEISYCFSGATFFLYSDQQVKEYENSDTRKNWTDKYFELLKPYNEFGYFKREHFSIYLDSKENFDNNYQSNWYYYYK